MDHPPLGIASMDASDGQPDVGSARDSDALGLSRVLSPDKPVVWVPGHGHVACDADGQPLLGVASVGAAEGQPGVASVGATDGLPGGARDSPSDSVARTVQDVPGVGHAAVDADSANGMQPLGQHDGGECFE